MLILDGGCSFDFYGDKRVKLIPLLPSDFSPILAVLMYLSEAHRHCLLQNSMLTNTLSSFSPLCLSLAVTSLSQLNL